MRREKKIICEHKKEKEQKWSEVRELKREEKKCLWSKKKKKATTFDV
jgi:hypothetical protein